MKSKITWIMLVIVFTACGTNSRISSTWKSENITTRQYDKVLVLGIIGWPDRTMRKKMEQHMTGDLKDLGYNAVSSMDEYGPKAFENMSEADALQLLYNNGTDAVVTIVLLDVEKEGYYMPARARNLPYSTYHVNLWPYYTTMFDRIYSPGSGYYAGETKYYWESNLYNLNKWSLVYSAQSQSFEPSNTQAMAHEYGLMIVKDMVKNGALQNQKSSLKAF